MQESKFKLSKANPGDARPGALGAIEPGAGLGAAAFLWMLRDESIRKEIGVKDDAYAAFENKARADAEKWAADRKGEFSWRNSSRETWSSLQPT